MYWSEQHTRAKSYLASTLVLSDGFVIVTGEVGCGKTTLIKAFLRELGPDVVCAVVSQTQLTPTQFLMAILTEFGFKPFKKKKVELLDMLNMFLIDQYSAGKKIILIVDEAQNLDASVLEEIRLLSGIETANEKVLRIILAGQPELKYTLRKPELRQLLQRVRLKVHLAALEPTEVRDYVEHRLRAAGREDLSLFNEDCYPEIFKFSGGIPRLINTICDSSLLVAFADKNEIVTAGDIDSAIQELNFWDDEDDTGQHRSLSHANIGGPTGALVTGIEVKKNNQTIAEHYFECGRTVVGRTPDNDISLDSSFISRHHLQLTSTWQGCFAEDLNSTNGTYLGGKSIRKIRLNHGDILSVGEHQLIYNDLRDAVDQTAQSELPDLDELNDEADLEDVSASTHGGNASTGVHPDQNSGIRPETDIDSGSDSDAAVRSESDSDVTQKA